MPSYQADVYKRQRLSNKVDRTVSKKFISEELLQKILVTIDEYIENNSGLEAKGNHEESFYLDVIIARLFIKLSLLLPLQTGQIIDIKLGDVRSTQFREIIHNDVKVKLPNNLRKDIINSVNYAEMKYRVKYSTEDKIFEYLYSCENKKGQREGINRTLPRVYEGLGLVEMLEKVSGGKRDKYIYPAGSYKKTAIYNMLNNGDVYKRQLQSFMEQGRALQKGDKVYAVCMNKSVAMFQIGEQPLEQGMNILGAHIDSPRLDVKQNPLYEDSDMAYLDTHYYLSLIHI